MLETNRVGDDASGRWTVGIKATLKSAFRVNGPNGARAVVSALTLSSSQCLEASSFKALSTASNVQSRASRMLGTPGLAGQVLCSRLAAPRWPRNVRVLGVHWLQVGAYISGLRTISQSITTFILTRLL